MVHDKFLTFGNLRFKSSSRFKVDPEKLKANGQLCPDTNQNGRYFWTVPYKSAEIHWIQTMISVKTIFVEKLIKRL